MTDKSPKSPLQATVHAFLTELSTHFPERHELILLKVIVEQVDGKVLEQLFVTHLLPKTELIEKRHESFFDKSNDVFAKLAPIFSTEKPVLTNLWESLEPEDRGVLWEWIESILKQTQKVGEVGAEVSDIGQKQGDKCRGSSDSEPSVAAALAASVFHDGGE